MLVTLALEKLFAASRRSETKALRGILTVLDGDLGLVQGSNYKFRGHKGDVEGSMAMKDD